MSEIATLSYLDIALACGFIVATLIVSVVMKLGLAKDLSIAALRTLLQLGLAGLVLGAVFRIESLPAVMLLVGVMILLAGREAVSRQRITLKGGILDAFTAMFLATALVGLTVTIVIVRSDPWWTPAVAIPLLGMIIGNSLNGISLSMDRFLSGCADRRGEIETRLALGATPVEATRPLVREALRAGMTPIINSMMIVGVVSLPGMMTGQLLAGADPRDAVLYQIVVMYMIAAGTAVGSVTAVLLARRRVFSEHASLRDDLRRVK